ncbi:MAG: LUD domain-containing protein [Verrucomicrobia bacterium]|nr:LUD domain-containing protein [Verrucomicrobiota bacterium]
MSRAAIFKNIEAATAAVKTKSAYPDYAAAITHSAPKLAGSDRLEIFSRNLAAVNGRTMHAVAELLEFLTASGQRHGYCDPVLYERVGAPLVAAGLTVETEYDRTRYDDYQFGITRASGAIAESGTLILDDHRTSRRLAALSPWVHVAVLERAEIHLTIADALAVLGDSPNIIWVTGPSKTADVEGILIEGVHGPGEQIALVL